MIRLLKRFFCLVAIIGFIIIIGTAGASDNDAISIRQLLIQLAIGVMVLIIGFVGANITEGLEYEDRRYSRDYRGL